MNFIFVHSDTNISPNQCQFFYRNQSIAKPLDISELLYYYYLRFPPVWGSPPLQRGRQGDFAPRTLTTIYRLFGKIRFYS